ncbi:MAG: tRNA pseudouridine(55) synthase TruB [Lachnospiraceae bacterium]
MYNGIICINKEAGFTSHDVVAKLRGILKQKKIGHTGTLDPDATGVLPVCLGKATKLCDLIADKTKEYEATLLLGTTTDTEDTSGTIVSQMEVAVTEEEVRQAILSFLGTYEQIPPMYSAKKVNGRKLYDLAREGIVVERKAATVTIHEIRIKKIHLPYVVMNVSCSKGTYIRSLCRDIGERLGCGGCMSALVRTRVSQFLLQDALTLSQIEELQKEDKMSSILYPVVSMFPDYPEIHFEQSMDKLLQNGNPVPERMMPSGYQEHRYYHFYDSAGTYIGIYEYQKENHIFKPYKLFFIEKQVEA